MAVPRSAPLMSSPSAPPLDFPELSRRDKVFTLVGSLLGLFLAALDQTIVATAGPVIQRDLQIEPSLYVWITTAYLVASTVLVPVYGKLSDLFGRKPILVSGVLIFLAGSVLCGLAQSTVQLILFRAVQGAGSAALFTTAFAVVADIFSPAERGKYQGLFGAVFGLSSVVGPLAGGFITDHFGWHWVFFVNLPDRRRRAVHDHHPDADAPQAPAREDRDRPRRRARAGRRDRAAAARAQPRQPPTRPRPRAGSGARGRSSGCSRSPRWGSSRSSRSSVRPPSRSSTSRSSGTGCSRSATPPPS